MKPANKPTFAAAIRAGAWMAMAALAAAAHAAEPDNAALGKLAGARDFPGLATLCEPAGPPPDIAADSKRVWHLPPAIPPAMPFDNVIFLGNKMVSAWAIKTSQGLILVDALDNAQEVQADIETGLRQFSLDPATIRYVIITHAHGDHYGGVQYLIDKYHPRVVMSERDWQVLAVPKQRIDLPEWGPPPRKDIAIDETGSVTLGDTTVSLIKTPGHTPGTLSLIFPVFSHGERHLAVLWGGTGFNFGPQADRYRMYADSAAKMRAEVLRQRIDVFLSNHVKRDYADRKLAEMAADPRSNPFVLSPERVAAAFDVFGYCARAQLDNLASHPM